MTSAWHQLYLVGKPYVLPHFSDVAFSIALYHVLLVVFVSCHSHVRHFINITNVNMHPLDDECLAPVLPGWKTNMCCLTFLMVH